MTVVSAKPANQRKCGGCKLCCTILPVLDIGKPQGVPCRHCAKGVVGCRIYNSRPYSCRTYRCSWLANPHVWSDDLRPDRCGFLIDFTEDGQVVSLTCDAEKMRRDPGRRPLLEAVASELRRHFTVIISEDITAGEARVMFAPGKTADDMIRSLEATAIATVQRTDEAIADGRIQLRPQDQPILDNGAQQSVASKAIVHAQ